MTQSIPSMRSLTCPEPSAPSTLTLTTCAPGARPRPLLSMVPAPAMMPARCVPWPYTSLPVPFGSIMSTRALTWPRSCGTTVTPESSSATPTFLPVTPRLPEAEAAGPRLVGASGGVGDRHLPAHDVIAGNLWDVRVGGELVEAPRRHLDDRAAREGAPDPQSVARREGRDLLGGAADDDCRRRGIAGIQMSLEIV